MHPTPRGVLTILTPWLPKTPSSMSHTQAFALTLLGLIFALVLCLSFLSKLVVLFNVIVIERKASRVKIIWVQVPVPLIA